jgi:protein required for attachment to host cells
MINPRSTHWVLVADGGQARILELRRKPYQFRQVAELVSETQHEPSRNLVSDADGRSFHVQGPVSHAKQPRNDPHDLAEEQFVRELLEKLDRAGNLGRFDYLQLIADPRTLGRLRQQMSKSLLARVAGETALDLVQLPEQQLEGKVRTILGWTA